MVCSLMDRRGWHPVQTSLRVIIWLCKRYQLVSPVPAEALANATSVAA